MAITKDVRQYAAVAFLLLGVLFGMVVMTYIFGQLGKASSSSLSDNTITEINVSGAYINETGYTIPQATDNNFNGGFQVTTAYNATDGSVIDSANYSVDSNTGTITNATAITFSDVNLSYTYQAKTDAKLATESANNNSLQSIVTYTNQSSTQFTTLAIAITLVVLIGLFLLFWNIFVSKKKSKSNKNGFEGTFG